MGYILALVQLVLVGMVTIYEYGKKSASVFLWAMSFIMFSMMHFLNVISNISLYPSWVYTNASLFVIGFTLVYFLMRIIILRDVDGVQINEINNKQFVEYINKDVNKRFITISIFIFCVTISYSIYTIITVSGGIFNSSWGSSYNYYSTLGYISFDKLVRWFFLPCGSVFLVGLISKNKRIILLTTLPILLFVLVSRNKADLLTLITGIISYFILKDKKIKVKNILAISIIGILGVYTIYALQVFRNLGSVSNIIGTISLNEFNNIVLSRMLSGQGELSLINVFYHFIYHGNNFPNFNKCHTYIRMLLVLIPTKFSFGLKPTDFAISMGSAWMMEFNNTAFSTHPTFFGDVFANAGYFGIFLGIFWAVLVFILDKIIDRKNLVLKFVLFNLFASNFILIGRGSVYNSYTSIVYGTIIIGIIYFISRVKLFNK